MKKLKLGFIAIILTISYGLTAQGVAINADGSAAASSAMLDVQSTDKGFLPPRMTESERDAIGNPVAGLMIWCIDCAELQVYNGSAWTNMVGGDAAEPPQPAIGDFMQGGVVFYVDGNGGGMVCAVTDQGPGAEWGCEGTDTGADGIVIGTGNQNTDNMLSGCPTSPAALACINLESNGYDDWYLPSQDELNAMYDNKDVINTTAGLNGGSDFANGNYWSSTETDINQAFRRNLVTGLHGDIQKSNTYHLRAVRSF